MKALPLPTPPPKFRGKAGFVLTRFVDLSLSRAHELGAQLPVTIDTV